MIIPIEKKHLTLFAILMFFDSSTFAGKRSGRKTKLENHKANLVEDIETQIMLKEEMETWTNAHEIARFIEIRRLVEGTTTVYNIVYEATDGFVCEGKLEISEVPVKVLKPYNFECSKGRELTSHEDLFGISEGKKDEDGGEENNNITAVTERMVTSRTERTKTNTPKNEKDGSGVFDVEESEDEKDSYEENDEVKS